MRFAPPLALAVSLLLSGAVCQAAQRVKVGVTIFPPYIEKDAGAGKDTLRVELLELMNAFQDTYRFEPVVTGTVRRFKDFDLGKYDMSTFDNLAWGWEDRPVDASNVYLRGGEVYVALASPGRNDSYFDNLAEKQLIAMLGYHYGFAGFNGDPDYLRQRFRIAFTNDNEASLKLLLLGRGEVAVVSEAFLTSFLARQPELRDRFLVSKKKDQVYSHTIIIRRGIRPSIAEINQLLERMRKAGVLRPLWKKYGAEQTDGN
ncbi:substrate-binding periplasmic protein [Chitinimonas naiadis]